MVGSVEDEDLRAKKKAEFLERKKNKIGDYVDKRALAIAPPAVPKKIQQPDPAGQLIDQISKRCIGYARRNDVQATDVTCDVCKVDLCCQSKFYEVVYAGLKLHN